MSGPGDWSILVPLLEEWRERIQDLVGLHLVQGTGQDGTRGVKLKKKESTLETRTESKDGGVRQSASQPVLLLICVTRSSLGWPVASRDRKNVR
jgi:hypothetical protein